jgi:hypothetical protein
MFAPVADDVISRLYRPLTPTCWPPWAAPSGPPGRQAPRRAAARQPLLTDRSLARVRRPGNSQRTTARHTVITALISPHAGAVYQGSLTPLTSLGFSMTRWPSPIVAAVPSTTSCSPMASLTSVAPFDPRCTKTFFRLGSSKARMGNCRQMDYPKSVFIELLHHYILFLCAYKYPAIYGTWQALVPGPRG